MIGKSLSNQPREKIERQQPWKEVVLSSWLSSHESRHKRCVRNRGEQCAQSDEERALRCRFAVKDFLAAPPPDGPFQFVFDRGCFHVFDEPGERQRFVEQVAAALAPGGSWLSLIGSTEGPQREVGPPRRSARDVILAIEPALEIVELRSAEFHGSHAKAWFCLSRQRTMPAQPSTRHD